MDRRGFLGFGFGSLLLAACGSRSQAAPRDALAPTPAIADDDPPPDDAGVCQITADNIEGPFYKKGAPSRLVLASDSEPGERLIITGTVRDQTCKPIANAELDLWHANTKGEYDNEGFGLRGKLRADAKGRFAIKTIVPGRYLNGRRYRPAHVHVKLRAADKQTLTTQLYFAGDPYNDGDDFIVSSLIMSHEVKDGARRAMFDFVL